MQAAEIRPVIESALRQWRFRLFWQRFLYLSTGAVYVLLLSRLTGVDNIQTGMLVAVVLLAGLVQLFFSRAWKRLTTDNFLQHLNRHFPEFEESAQLLLLNDKGLSLLQQLQRKRVLEAYTLSEPRINASRPAIRYRTVAVAISIALVLMPFVNQFKAILEPVLTRGNTTRDVASTAQPGGSANRLTASSVIITPPEYTGLPVIETEEMNLDITEGSRVLWKLSFDDPSPAYALAMADDLRLPLMTSENGGLQASATINKTGLYRIVWQENDIEQSLEGIYAVSVKLDQPPDIRLLEPQYSSLEIPQNADPTFKTRALVMDDFGVKNAEILASVAKGSGEAVKFRDLGLEFERSRNTAKGIEFERDWNLAELGMEPGDELYFTVIARDNKQPEANQGRSQTIIVRWLDDDPTGLAAEGLAMDFVPEFFKSQRQIIIDTEQLLEDHETLTGAEFKDQSRSIGQSQADLKQKYGQYLGDEFDEGPPLQIGESHEQESAEKDHHGHQAGELEKDVNITSTADILNRFGHNHGDPEIGPITRNNPVALMKRAVSEMWQAERHLMQAEPRLALPFEYEAYKYLKLARQADRIYVKRLGFVPPPVTEERRLSGKLDDIYSYSLSADIQLDKAGERHIQGLLHDIFQVISRHSSEYELDEKQRQALRELSRLFSSWSQQAPELIKQAATIEKMLQANRFELADCKACVKDLQSAIWELIRDPFIDLRFRKPARPPADDMLNTYQNLADQNSASLNTVTTEDGELP